MTRHPLPKRHRPGTSWRAQWFGHTGGILHPKYEARSTDHPQPTVFDELVVDGWLHLEQLDNRLWYIQIGPLFIDVHVGERGEAKDVLVQVRNINQYQPTRIRWAATGVVDAVDEFDPEPGR